MIPIEIAYLEPHGEVRVRPGTEFVTGMQIDSRRIVEGDLFVAMGAGEEFIDDAFARGAAAVLIPKYAHTALGTIGGEVRRRSSARVVGITGATGKTTTKDILAALCSPHLRTVASEANYNNEIGVPLTLCRIEADTELCIVEMGMRGLGQIQWLAQIAQPDIGLITNIGPVHLELVGTIQNVAQAKAELIEMLPLNAVVVVPDDEPLLDPHLLRSDLDVRRFGHVDEPGAFRVGGRVIELQTSFTSRHQLDNTLAALTVCDALGVPLEPGVLDIEFSPLREELIELPGGVTLINDCYNANPLSMRAALRHLADRAGTGRRIAVLGGMAELGDYSEWYHRELGAELAVLGVDRLIAVGELARPYLETADEVESSWVAAADEAADLVRSLAASGDVVLVKGSRSVGLEAVAAKLES
ncbi:MAG: UDP-N-acetylmuramoyl-tripeptide--D-alanyl-D-alanine ligase [Actinomycetes bacterium]